MSDDGMQEFFQQMRERDQRKQQFSDDYRKSQITQYMSAANHMQKSIALLLNPDTMQAMPGKEQQVAQLRTQLGQVDEYIKKLYSPNVNPYSGMVNEDPLHKLTDKLRLTHPPAGNKTAAQQLKDLSAIRQQYAGYEGEESAESTLTAGATQRRDKEQQIGAARGLLKKYGMNDEAISDVTEKLLGVTPHQQKEQWDLLQGSVGGQSVSWLKNKYDGSVTDLAGNPVPSDQLQNFVATPKTTAKPRKGWGKDANGRFYSVLLDPFTNQKVPNSENYHEQPPASLSGRVTTGYYHFTDSEGNIHQVEETKTSTPAGSAGAPRSGTPKPSASGPSTPRLPGQQINDLAAMRDKSNFGQANPAMGGDKILGRKDTPEAVAAKKIADVLDTDASLADYRLTHRSPPGDTGIVMSWVRAQVRGAGRMTNVEIEQGLKSGSFEQRFTNAYQKGVEGTLGDDFIRNMVADIKAAAKAARDTADKYKNGASSDSNSDIDDIVKALNGKQ